ncbi:hypothetical protein D7X33_20965 [Butyricicoccus sp. 1XD8-22]|nr:hypothetical protein D7X33_20965 [Butyricicoccus sp. 1XD8-22]
MTTQKTNTRKPRTTKTVKPVEEVVEKVEVTQVVEDVTIKEEVKVEEKPKKNTRKSIATVDLNDLVPVVALIDSVIFVADNTKAEYEWDSKGDIQYITYGELISMKGRQKRFLEEMWLYIDDEEVVEALNLTSLYEKYDEIKSLEDYLSQFTTNHELKQVLTPLPNGIKKSLGRQAAQLIQDGEFDKFKTIKTLEECLGVELTHLLD